MRAELARSGVAGFEAAIRSGPSKDVVSGKKRSKIKIKKEEEEEEGVGEATGGCGLSEEAPVLIGPNELPRALDGPHQREGSEVEADTASAGSHPDTPFSGSGAPSPVSETKKAQKGI